MAALAESLVDEWLNRSGFFTVRGLKDGVEEIDLLGVRPNGNSLEGWHVEVQVSFRPIGYISPLLREYVGSFADSKSSMKTRPIEILEPCVVAWVKRKFLASKKQATRESAWKGLRWQYVFVHGVVKDSKELALIERQGIRLIPLHQILAELKHEAGRLKGGAGTDLWTCPVSVDS